MEGTGAGPGFLGPAPKSAPSLWETLGVLCHLWGLAFYLKTHGLSDMILIPVLYFLNCYLSYFWNLGQGRRGGMI